MSPTGEMNRTRIIATLLVLVLCGGCIVLPIPHRRLHAYGVRGSVVDADSGLPIRNALVELATGIQGPAHSDEQGRFEIKPTSDRSRQR